MWIVPHGAARERVLVCIHGGGLIAGSMCGHRTRFAHIAKGIGCRVLTFEHCCTPERNRPTPLEDATSVDHWLLDQGISANHVTFQFSSGRVPEPDEAIHTLALWAGSTRDLTAVRV
jgi:acetyl esterase/lipase